MIQARFVALLNPMTLFATLPALAAFSVTSTTLQDGVVADKSLGNNTADGRGTPCGGQGLSPHLFAAIAGHTLGSATGTVMKYAR